MPQRCSPSRARRVLSSILMGVARASDKCNRVVSRPRERVAVVCTPDALDRAISERLATLEWDSKGYTL